MGNLADSLYRLTSERVTVLISNPVQMRTRTLKDSQKLSGGRQIIKWQLQDDNKYFSYLVP